MKHVIHVHQQRMRSKKPAIIDRTYKRSTHHTKLDIVCKRGEVAATVIQHEEQDACGAHIWIEAEYTAGDGEDSTVKTNDGNSQP